MSGPQRRVVDAEAIAEAVAAAYIEANVSISADITGALAQARSCETSPAAQATLDILLQNAAVAAAERMPACQDTGMAVVFVEAGQDVYIAGDLNAAIHEGIRRGCREGCLRASVVGDPARRVNTGDNTPAVIHYDIVPGDHLRIGVMAKGFGSENMSALKMLTPADGIAGVEDFIVDAVRAAGANPCPPLIIGAGIGGTMEKAALLAKQALFRPVSEANTDPFWAEMETRLLERINALGIGPAGFGGLTTALAVHILAHPTHIAGLPAAVNIGCHATRHRTVLL